MNEMVLSKREEVLQELHNLKKLNSNRSKYSLVGLAFVFCISLSFFLFSDKIFSSETSSLYIRELENAVEKELSALTREAGMLRGEMDKNERETAPGATTAQSGGARLQSARIETTYSELEELYSGVDSRKSLLMKELETLQ